MWSLQQNQLISNQCKGSRVFPRMSILKHLESSHCQVLEVSTAASILQIVFSALAFSWCPKAPSWSKQGNQYGCSPMNDFHVRNLLWTGVPSHFWRLWLLIWLVGFEFPLGLFLFLSNNALHSNWPKQILVLSHWLNSRAPFMVYPSPPFKFKGWKHSNFRNVFVFFLGSLESIYPVELWWNFDLYTLGHGKCGILPRSGFCCTFRDRIGWLVELWNHVCIWVYDYVAGKPLNFRIQSTLPALDRNSWNTSPKGRGSALIQTINVLVLSVSPCQVFGWYSSFPTAGKLPLEPQEKQNTWLVYVRDEKPWVFSVRDF